MKLKMAHIKEFKSIWDSNIFEIDKVTCLVGKNESGKTAILQALYRLNPIIKEDGMFDLVHDYPRSEVEDYEQDIESRRREHAKVVEATFELETPEMEAIREEYGEGVLAEPVIKVSKGYDKNKKSWLLVSVPVLEFVLVKNLVESFDLPESLRGEAKQKDTLKQLSTYLTEMQESQAQNLKEAKTKVKELEDEAEKAAALEKCKEHEESEQAKALRGRLAEFPKVQDLSSHIWEKILKPYFPKFLYFDEYYQMKGHDNVQALKKRETENKLKPSDRPLLGLIDLARLDLDKLMDATQTQELKNKLEGASTFLSKKILKYWSQNKHLRMTFDVRPGLKDDPEGMKEGMNIWGEINDTTHLATMNIGTRSAGFVWFFSFLAWYSAVKKKDEPLVLLLDEPGLSLHGKAQEDLLNYFEAEIVTNPKHQLLYTTHSPFMVDSKHFDRVRIVQDKGIDSKDQLPREEDGTKVFTDVLEAGPDSLFPLQGALGYEIYQTLFIGPNSLVVEGASDLLYIQTVSGILQSKGCVGLDSRWTITPVGGADKVPTFVALIGSQKNLKIATLIDIQKSHQQMIENLFKKKLLERSRVLTFGDFTGKAEADIEDMFDEGLYLQLVNDEFSSALRSKIEPKDLLSQSPRILRRLEDYFNRNPLNGGAKFNHYRPARFFAEQASNLKISELVLDRFEKAFKAVNALL
ncbi:MAG TPA: AAA family ATPase [Nitrospiria bacterium]|jgi:predicted ATP-dependent endonuclease of OLD family